MPVEVACDEEQRDTERVIEQGGDGRPEGGVDDLDYRPKPARKQTTVSSSCQQSERESEREKEGTEDQSPGAHERPGEEDKDGSCCSRQPICEATVKERVSRDRRIEQDKMKEREGRTVLPA